MATRVTNNTFALPSLLKEGTKHLQGPEEAIYRNIAACNQVVQMTASSYGPLGLSKLIINQHGKLVFTSDAGVILKEVGVEHPAARIILMAAEQQKREQGDASGWVCIMVSEWLSKAEELLRMGMSASQVVDGFETAALKAEEILAELAYIGEEEGQVIKTALMSKQYGQEDLLTDLVEKAIEIIQRDDKSIINPDNVRVVKILGGSLLQSTVLKGMLFNKEVEGKVKSVVDASSPFIKVAIYACPLGAGRTETKGTVLFNNAQEMLAFNKGEEAQIHAQIKAIAEAGVRVVVSGDTISEVAMHFLDAYNILAFKIPSKFDLKRLARALGASPLARLGAPMEEEMGRAESVETIEVGADRCVLFKASENAGDLATILLRGSNANQLDDVERAIEDAIASVKATRRDKRLLPGAGATESELSRRLQAFPRLVPVSVNMQSKSLERHLMRSPGFSPRMLV